MADYRFSKRAAMDLEAIAEYTIERFGIEQARRYRDDLGTCFEQLAANARLGRRAEQLGPALRRYEHRSHIVFYQTTDTAILIVRVLHYRMDVTRHL
ncbi:type II toxin-antitoxin system RelE/ParE family toxin [Lentisalinibacter salinarum]|uniref:type II toxin-antitoxin system RelE/ParE family toxin n=1 Tax=Lentisalinibacter salinarum TaxID=2992239 RepID=UPI00386FC3E4